jgi:hypothetical protein
VTANTDLAPDDAGEIAQALLLLERLSTIGPTRWIGGLEQVFSGTTGARAAEKLKTELVDEDLLSAALLVKRAAGQINVLIHAIGILIALPRILEPGEVVESLSLGAGNTGRTHDLETDRQIAEFTFIEWRGGPESIRQNKVFGDVFALASAKTAKRRVLYVTGKAIPIRFLENRRALSSVLKDAPLERRFRELHGTRFVTVRDYWLAIRGQIEVVDLAEVIPAFAHDAGLPRSASAAPVAT